MPYDDDEIEIGILPTVPTGTHPLDCVLQHWSPVFGPCYVVPDERFASTLAVLGYSTAAYIQAVRTKYGLDLTSARDTDVIGRGCYAWRGEYGPRWKALSNGVRTNPRTAKMLELEQLFEIMENASYGGILSIAGYFARRDLTAARQAGPVIRVTGRKQIGIIDYVNGSGHSVTVADPVIVDIRQGQVIDAEEMGYSWDGTCGFVRSYFQIDRITSWKLDPGVRSAREFAPKALAA